MLHGEKSTVSIMKYCLVISQKSNVICFLYGYRKHKHPLAGSSNAYTCFVSQVPDFPLRDIHNLTTCTRKAVQGNHDRNKLQRTDQGKSSIYYDHHVLQAIQE